VLAVGGARAVTDPQAVADLDGLAFSKPWAGGDRDLWIVLTPARVTGRRILVGGAPGLPGGG
jgi:hypothetical protein